MVFDLQVRLDYVKYCIPDWSCKGGYKGIEVLDVGPYAPGRLNVEPPPADQASLAHILRCSRWRRLWEPVTSSEGPILSEEWKHKLWKEAVQIQGLAGMEVVTLKDGSGVRKWSHRLRELREKIHRLSEKDKPKAVLVGEVAVEVSENVPDFYREMYLCNRKLAMGTEAASLIWRIMGRRRRVYDSD